MTKEKVNTGDVFLAHNKYMKPPKLKYHLCISKNMYFLINSKPHEFNCEITPKDCPLLEHNSYINCTVVRTEPLKEFIVIKKEELSNDALKRLITKIKYVPTITPIQKKFVLKELQICVENRV